MNFSGGASGMQRFIFSLLVCAVAVLGYLLYSSHSENVRVQKLLSETREENLDLSQDIEIVKQKYDNLEKHLKQTGTGERKVVYKKPAKKKVLSAAGKSGKKSYYKKGKVNYRKLYFELKRQCQPKQNYSKKVAKTPVGSYSKPKYR